MRRAADRQIQVAIGFVARLHEGQGVVAPAALIVPTATAASVGDMVVVFAPVRCTADREVSVAVHFLAEPDAHGAVTVLAATVGAQVVTGGR